MNMLRRFCFLLLMIAPATAMAQQPALAWNITPEQSSIRWQATQNHAPLEGSFTSYTAEIRFHPDALASSYAKVSIDTASITTSYEEAQADLQKPEWFDVAQFPLAVFEASQFTAIDAAKGIYRADGTLTIKGKSQPLALEFTLKHFSETEAHIEGEAALNRSDFSIGWADTDSVTEAVTVKVTLKAIR